jgi:hypothetical protein
MALLRYRNLGSTRKWMAMMRSRGNRKRSERAEQERGKSAVVSGILSVVIILTAQMIRATRTYHLQNGRNPSWYLLRI